jgi:hypothetical protein
MLKDMMDLSKAAGIKLLGRGGKEQEISGLLPNFKRVSSSLYDFERFYDGGVIRVEVKKQKNLQWFDSGKYYNLSKDDRDIFILFVLTDDKGSVDAILCVPLGKFINWLCENKREEGWTEEVMKKGHEWKSMGYKVQLKVPVKIRDIFTEKSGLFDVIYVR